MYVIKRTDGVYVARPGSRSSYTPKLQDAQVFNTRAEADRARCPGNEIIVSVEGEMHS